MDYYKSLRNVPYFRTLSDTDIRQISAVCKESFYSSGEIIFSEGDEAKNFFIVISGQVSVVKNHQGPEPEILGRHGPGNFFGEMALIDDMPRSATVVTDSDTIVLYLSKTDFEQIIQTNASVAISIMMGVSQMIRKSNTSFVEGLHQRNKELEAANMELKTAQDSLLKAERLSTLGKFSSLILHDLKNPLSILKGYAQMAVLHIDEKEKIQKCLNNIIREADRMDRLSNELLDYSRGEVRLNMKVVQVPDFFQKLRETIDIKFQARNIDLIFDNHIDNPILMDDERMFRVFCNIADNAWKAMHKGGSLFFRAYKQGSLCVFEIEDTGEGMSDETMKKIFEPFFSFSGGGGTGLGMLVVKNIVEAHEGTVAVTSQEGHGTMVKLSLPISA